MRVLFVLTESPNRDEALRFARQTALSGDGSLSLLAVGAEPAAVDRLRETSSLGLIPQEYEFRKFRTGNLHEQVLDEIRSGEYDLTVIGSDPRTDEDAPHITPAAHLARLSESPLAIVNACPPDLQRAMICSREANLDLPTVRSGQALGRRLGVEPTVLHVIVGSSTDQEVAQRRAEDLLIRHGPLIQEIQGEIARQKPDLVIIGPHTVPPASQGSGPTLARPDFTQQIIRLAPPVVIIMGQPALEEKPARAFKAEELSKILRTVAIELLIYAVLVTLYAAVAFHFLGDPLAKLFEENLLIYAIAALILIIAQGVLLEQLTSFLLDRLRLERFG